jgi:hypothetical protein
LEVVVQESVVAHPASRKGTPGLTAGRRAVELHLAA